MRTTFLFLLSLVVSTMANGETFYNLGSKHLTASEINKGDIHVALASENVVASRFLSDGSNTTSFDSSSGANTFLVEKVSGGVVLKNLKSEEYFGGSGSTFGSGGYCVDKLTVSVLDASGSLGADRLNSCRSAARRILRSAMNSGDRFNLVAFRNRFDYAFARWQECTAATFEQADKWLVSLTSHGRTDVFSTIRSVLTLPRDPTRPLIALVVTDGDANSGVSETAEILSKFTALNDGLISVYMYGVKGSANRELIEVLTRGNRGESFIFDGIASWRAGSGLESLSERFRDPVLSDLRLVFTTESQVEAYPRILKNLYRGDAVTVTGRVPKGTKQVMFSLQGLNGSRAYDGLFTLELEKAAVNPEVAAAWAEERAVDGKLR